jgi:hypothetical protein
VEPIDRLRLARRGLTVSAEAVAQRVAESLIDLVMKTVDLNMVLQLVDFNALLGRVDVNTLLRQVDVNILLEQIDINALLKQVDLNELLDQLDMGAVLDRVDLNEVAGRIDMEKLAAKTDFGAIITRSTGGIAAEALDSARAGAVGLDQLVDRWLTRLLRRKTPGPLAPPALLSVAAQPGAADGEGETG